MKRTRTWLAPLAVFTMITALACTLPLAPSAWAQGYPNKPVRVIVQYPPGGTPDIYGRIMSAELSKLWNQSVVVENRTGASGTIGTDMVAKAAPDGYTLLFASDAPITIVPNLMSKLPYDPVRDLQPISNVASGGFVLMLHPSVPATNLKELIAWIRAQNGKASFASSGNGSQQQLSMELIRTMAGGLDMIHIPYKGFGQGLADALAGQVPMIFGGATASIQITKSGKLKGMGITTKTRAKMLPDVPAIAEEFPGYEILAWYGFLGPAGLPRDIVNKIHADVVTIVRRPDFQERIIRDALDPIGNTPEEFAAQIKADLAKWAPVIKASGAKLD
jgi:tripartite-type tricarboxylate transporter receptor subunit TctC